MFHVIHVSSNTGSSCTAEHQDERFRRWQQGRACLRFRMMIGCRPPDRLKDSATIGSERHVFFDLVTLLAKASPLRSGDVLAGIAAQPARSAWPAACLRLLSGMGGPA
jgi:hypothetical protein